MFRWRITEPRSFVWSHNMLMINRGWSSKRWKIFGFGHREQIRFVDGYFDECAIWIWWTWSELLRNAGPMGLLRWDEMRIERERDNEMIVLDIFVMIVCDVLLYLYSYAWSFRSIVAWVTTAYRNMLACMIACRATGTHYMHVVRYACLYVSW